MTLEEIPEIISNIESRFEVDKWEVDGVKIWPFIRIENYCKLAFKALEVGAPNTRSGGYVKAVLESKFRSVYAQVLDFKMNAQSDNADIVLMSGGVSFTKVNGKWYEKFCDPIYDYYKQKGVSLTRFDPSHCFLIPRYSPSFFIQTRLDNIIIGTLIKNKFQMSREVDANWGDYELFLQDEFANKNLGVVPSKESIINKIRKVNNLKEFYLKKLRILNPKIAFVVCYYSDAVMAFLLACKQLGIKTVDLQHGVQGDLHLAYGQWNRVPTDGYGSLPDYFWVWSNLEKEAIDSWNKGITTHQALVGGNLFLEQWKDDSSEIVIECDSIFQKAQLLQNKPSILLTLSPGVLTDDLMGQTWDVVKNTQQQYNWNIRLHPSMLDEKNTIKENLKKRGIFQYELDVCSELPLYSVLRNVSLHITVQSSTVLEAGEFGIKSIITSDYGEALYRSVIEYGEAYIFKSSPDIIKKIKSLVDDEKRVKISYKQSEKDAFKEFNKILERAR